MYAGWITLVSALFFSSAGFTEVLSEEALFHRCYSQITQSRASTNHPLLSQVKTGQLTAAGACHQVLSKGNLGPGGDVTLSGDPEARMVVNNFHSLHFSWFSSKDYPIISSNQANLGTKDLIDSTSPALFLTQSLFQPAVPYNSILSQGNTLKPVRTTASVTGPASSRDKTGYSFNTNFDFALVGDLVGISPISSQVVGFQVTNNDGNPGLAGSVDFYKHFGGGLLGSTPYLLLNLKEVSGFRANGGLKMPRKWSKAIFNDLLCREIPVVETNDVLSFVDTGSSVAFRNSAACVSCHASIDRMSSTIRNIRYYSFGSNRTFGGDFLVEYPTNQPAVAGWPAEPDANYSNRPTTGHLFYRNYKGDLVNQTLTGVADLGQKLSAQDDMYICAAKRYYAYFFGIDIDLNNYKSESLSAEELAHKTSVIALGKSFGVHQNLQKLILDIISLPNYKKSDFGTGGG